MQDTEGGAAAKKVGLLARMARWVKSSNSEVVLGQGLARQVGNVTECALLGFLVDLSEFGCFKLCTHFYLPFGNHILLTSVYTHTLSLSLSHPHTHTHTHRH